MKFRISNHLRAWAALSTGLFLLAGQAQASLTVAAGWDLLQTDPTQTTFMGTYYEGVPLGSYDFGGGPLGIGNTDTIVRRIAPAIGPAPAIIPIELVALQLRSVMPIDLGAGLNFHYITLQSARGGPLSPGQMTITFGPEGNPHGTFDSFFDVYFDVRFGSLNGPILLSSQLQLSSAGTPWSHEPAGSLLIDGVNHKLNGTDRLQDFWPVGAITETHPSGAVHVVTPVPESSTFFAGVLLAGLMGASMLLHRLRGKRNAPR